MTDPAAIAAARRLYGDHEHPSVYRMISDLRISWQQTHRVIEALDALNIPEPVPKPRLAPRQFAP